MLTLHLFGGFAADHNGIPLALPSHASKLLLAYCATHPAQAHTRSLLAGLLWPDRPETTARRRLSHALWELGQALPRIGQDGYLLPTADAIVFNPQLPHAIDVVAFQRSWERAQVAPQDDQARQALQQAVALYTGDYLAGFYEDWVLVEQERLRALYLEALRRLVQAEKGAGDYDAALRAVRTWIAADSLWEEAYQEGIRLCLELGRPQEARRLYEQCQAALQAELGVEPAPETAALLAQAPREPTPRAALAFSDQDLPLVGRSAERRTLLTHLDRALQGQGGLVLVAGEAGIGKSRLLRALAEDARWRSMAVLWGYARDQAGDAPYAPLMAALQDGLSELRARQLTALLDPLWLRVAGLLLPQLAAWLPQKMPALPPMQPEQERIRLLEGMVRLVQALGEIRPTLLILEDLHWADAATFDALTYLAQRLVDGRVLLAASLRPEEAQARSPVWEGLSSVLRVGVQARVHLEPLAQDETGRLIQQGLGLAEPAARFTARLHRETGGNPLFVLESLRTLHAEGLLVQDDRGNWITPFDQETDDYGELPLSPALDRTVGRRLARLDPQARSVLAAASILGSEVDLSLLLQVSNRPGRALMAALADLTRHSLLQETPTAYRFSHDLVRQVVYGELPAAERKGLHLRAAAALAEVPGSAPAALVAYHYQAGEAWPQAAHFHWRAGQEAAALHSYAAALAHLDQAATLIQSHPQAEVDRFALLSLREEVLGWLGQRERQEADLEVLARLAGVDPKARLAILRRHGSFLNAVGNHGEALARLEEARSLAQEQADPEAEATVLAAMGQTLYWSGEAQAAQPVLREAIRRARAAEAPGPEADAQAILTGILYDLSDHEGATAAAERAIVLYRSLDNPVGEADVLATLGAVAMEQGRLDDADAYYARALPVIQASGYRYAEARCLVNWGTIDYLRGRLGHGLARFRLGANIFRQVGSERGMHFTHLNIAATVSTYVGQDAEAERQTREALAAFARQANLSAKAQAAGILAQFAYLRGDYDQALAHYGDCFRSLAEHPDPWVEAQSYASRATVHLAREAWRVALQDVEAGLALCARYGFQDLAPLLHALESQALLGLARLEEARAAMARSVAARTAAEYAAATIYLYQHRTLARLGEPEAALAAIQRAHQALERLLESLSPADQARSRREIPEHRAILEAWDAYRPVERRVHLPRVDAPLGRPLEPGEEVEVTWTVETAADRAVAGKAQRRQQQIRRLLRQAQAQGALPAYHHLAEALGVSERTIKRDMAVLRAREPELPPTRGG
ncbi:MAG: hypothetical protein KatS3mg050_0824 [Litorilinea sp.]|nr:MAG: hypothetical protein KatS3mg050_0824 [Litorilinea sp.]